MGDRYEIHARRSPFETKLLLNGEPLENVQKFALQQSAEGDGLAKLTLYVAPELVDVTVEGVESEIITAPPPCHPLAMGYDPYNSADALFV